MKTYQYTDSKQKGFSLIFFLITLVLMICALFGWYMYYTSENNLSQLSSDNDLLQKRYNKNVSELFNLQMKQQQLRNQRFDLEQKLTALEAKNIKLSQSVPKENNAVQQQLNECLANAQQQKTQLTKALVVNENQQQSEQLLACEALNQQNKQLTNTLAEIEKNLLANKNSEKLLSQQIKQLKTVVDQKPTVEYKEQKVTTNNVAEVSIDKQQFEQLKQKNQQLEDANADLNKKIQLQEKSLNEAQTLMQDFQQLKQQLTTLNNKQQQSSTELKKVQQINENKQQQNELLKQQIKKDQLVFSQLQQEFSAELKSDHFSLDLLADHSSQFSINNAIMFTSGSTNISAQGAKLLKKIAIYLRKYAERRIEIIGHTDDIPMKNSKNRLIMSNWELSALRSGAVIRYLQHGEEIAPQRLLLVGASQYQPMIDEANNKARAKNRRTEIRLMGSAETQKN